MRISTDHAFHIGSQHLRGGMPCQDFALSEASQNIAYAIVSDGCSSGGMTDVGARIVTLNTATAMRRIGRSEFFHLDTLVAELDATAAENLWLGNDDLLATCCYVHTHPDCDEVTMRIVGDGVMATTDLDGDLVMIRIEWAGNMPVYRAYRTDGYCRFIAAHGGDTSQPRAERIWHTRTDLERDDGVIPITLGEGMWGVSHCTRTKFFRSAAVFSDGVTQVDGMDWRDVVAELMAFKSTEGDFVKRRMNRFLKDCLKHGKGPIDDISMACIHIDHEAS